VQFLTDTISRQQYRAAMKVLKVVPALMVVCYVAILIVKRRGMIFVPLII
jgi:hypothetical protein